MTVAQKRERPEGSRANAEKSTVSTRIVGRAFADRKTIETLKARGALAGHEVWVAKHAGRITLSFHRSGQSRVFTHPHDASAFLTQLREVAMTESSTHQSMPIDQLNVLDAEGQGLLATAKRIRAEFSDAHSVVRDPIAMQTNEEWLRAYDGADVVQQMGAC